MEIGTISPTSRATGTRKTGPAGLVCLHSRGSQEIGQEEDGELTDLAVLSNLTGLRQAWERMHKTPKAKEGDEGISPQQRLSQIITSQSPSGRSAGVTPRSRRSARETQSQRMTRMLLTHQNTDSALTQETRSESSICSNAKHRFSQSLRSDRSESVASPTLVQVSTAEESGVESLADRKAQLANNPPTCRENVSFFEMPRHKHCTWNPQNHLQVAFSREHFGAFAHYVQHKDRSRIVARAKSDKPAFTQIEPSPNPGAPDGVDRKIATLLDPVSHYEPYRHRKADTLDRVATTKTCVIPKRISTAPPEETEIMTMTMAASQSMKLSVKKRRSRRPPSQQIQNPPPLPPPPPPPQQAQNVPPGSAFAAGHDIYDPLGNSEFGWEARK